MELIRNEDIVNGRWKVKNGGEDAYNTTIFMANEKIRIFSKEKKKSAQI